MYHPYMEGQTGDPSAQSDKTSLGCGKRFKYCEGDDGKCQERRVVLYFIFYFFRQNTFVAFDVLIIIFAVNNV